MAILNQTNNIRVGTLESLKQQVSEPGLNSASKQVAQVQTSMTNLAQSGSRLAQAYSKLTRSVESETAQSNQIQKLREQLVKNYRTEAAQTRTSQASNAPVRNNAQMEQFVKGFIGGQVLSRVTGAFREATGQATSNYSQLNRQYTFDPNLRASQARNFQADFQLGKTLSSYEQVKADFNTGFKQWLTQNPSVAIGAQISKDLGGGVVGDFVGAAVGAGGSIGNAGRQILGKAGDDPARVLQSAFGADFDAGRGQAIDSLKGKTFTEADKKAISEFNGLFQKFAKDLKEYNAGKLSREDLEKSKNATQSAYEKLNVSGVAFDKSFEFRNQLFGDAGISERRLNTIAGNFAGINQAANGGRSQQEQQLLNDIFNSPQFKLQAQQTRNRISDFKYDTGRKEEEINISEARGKEDIATSRKRNAEDYAVAVKKINISIARANEDYAIGVARNELSVTRIKRDSAVQQSRIEEDYNRNTLRLKEDTGRAKLRLEEDTQTSLTRLIADSSRNLARLEEDSATSSIRLTEDTNKARLRANEDFAKSRADLTRSSGRSRQDLDTSYQDSIVGLFAPGLANSKAYQFMKLQRDYSKQKGRLREDTALGFRDIDRQERRTFEDIDTGERRGREDIDRSLGRGREDIARERGRGLEDLSRQYGRGNEDIDRSNARAEEDLARERSRASFDLLTQTTDALKDAELQLADITRQFQRSMQDAALALDDATRSFNRNNEDISKAERRMNEDIARQRRDLNEERRRFGRDLDLELGKEGANLPTEKPLSPDELKKAMDLPSYDIGTPYVPRDQLALLHRGEAVLPPGLNPYTPSGALKKDFGFDVPKANLGDFRGAMGGEVVGGDIPKNLKHLLGSGSGENAKGLGSNLDRFARNVPKANGSRDWDVGGTSMRPPIGFSSPTSNININLPINGMAKKQERQVREVAQSAAKSIQKILGAL